MSKSAVNSLLESSRDEIKRALKAAGVDALGLAGWIDAMHNVATMAVHAHGAWAERKIGGYSVACRWDGISFYWKTERELIELAVTA